MGSKNKDILKELTREKWLLYAIITFIVWNGLYVFFLLGSNDFEFLTRNKQLVSNIFYVLSIPINTICFLVFSTLFIAPKLNQFYIKSIEEKHSNHLEEINLIIKNAKNDNLNDITLIVTIQPLI